MHAFGDVLEHAAIQTRVTARTLLEDVRKPASTAPWIAPDKMGSALAAVLSATADAVRAFTGAASGNSNEMNLSAALENVERARADANDSAKRDLALGLPPDWAVTGEILAPSSRLVADLADAKVTPTGNS